MKCEWFADFKIIKKNIHDVMVKCNPLTISNEIFIHSNLGIIHNDLKKKDNAK